MPFTSLITFDSLIILVLIVILITDFPLSSLQISATYRNASSLFLDLVIASDAFGMSGFARVCRAAFKRSFSKKNLIWTNTISSGVLLAFGDVIEQRLEMSWGKASKYDLRRTGISHSSLDLRSRKISNLHATGRMFAVGLSQGPLHHYWYGYLDRVLPSRSLRTVGLKILADQLAAAPFFAITFFYGMGLLQGKGLDGCWTEFVAKFPAVYLVSC